MIIDKIFLQERDAFLQEYHKNEEEMLNNIDTNYNNYIPSLPRGEYKKALLKKIIINDKYKNNNDNVCFIQLNNNDIELLKSISCDLTRRLMFALMCYKQVYNHPSGWIKFNADKIIQYGLSDFDIKKNNINIKNFSSCTQYGFKMMIRGNSDPITCYNIVNQISTTSNNDNIVIFDSKDSLRQYDELFGGLK